MNTTPRRANAGFTLIETVIAMAVAAVMSSIAVPALQGHVHKARRADGLVALMSLQLAQERWRANAAAYGSLAEIGASPVSPQRHYLIEVIDPSATGFAALASATGVQAADRACRHLRLSLVAGSPRYQSGPDTTVANSAADNRRCWSL
jgi:type IV pilus assembly protein PilE